MNLNGVQIGFAITGSFYTFKNVIEEIEKLVKLEANIIPIMSNTSYTVDSKYGKSEELVKQLEHITKNKVIHTIQEAEKLVHNNIMDIMVIAPATSNTIAKISNNISDTTITTTLKYHLREKKPVVIGIACNDGLSSSGENIGRLLDRKNYYFVPFGQTNPITKPCSLYFDPKYLIKTIQFALNGEQLQPILV
ncbi:MAG: dipicolinate synthase subunit B [Clostridia bacterium]|nr:dipicolinate synthase subunit B [Clostridia bacterium]